MPKPRLVHRILDMNTDIYDESGGLLNQDLPSRGERAVLTEQSLRQSPEATQTLDKALGIRAKTSLRLKYEAESQVLLKKFGGLSGIQTKLNLSQRKICQLLMVDPSSWSRWMLDEAKTPPHILRALEWYLVTQDKYPGFDVHFWLHSNGKTSGATLERTQLLHEDLTKESAELKIQIQLLEKQVGRLENEVSASNQISRIPQVKPEKQLTFLKGFLSALALVFSSYLVLSHFLK